MTIDGNHQPLFWEALDATTSRAAVLGGWLVVARNHRTRGADAGFTIAGITFVPDAEHVWQARFPRATNVLQSDTVGS